MERTTLVLPVRPCVANWERKKQRRGRRHNASSSSLFDFHESKRTDVRFRFVGASTRPTRMQCVPVTREQPDNFASAINSTVRVLGRRTYIITTTGNVTRAVPMKRGRMSTKFNVYRSCTSSGFGNLRVAPVPALRVDERSATKSANTSTNTHTTHGYDLHGKRRGGSASKQSWRSQGCNTCLLYTSPSPRDRG